MRGSQRANRFNAQEKSCIRSNGESGQTILIVALALVVLILAAGLAIDIGYMRYQKRLVQMAADSAAIAGAANMIAGAADVNCTGAACASGEAGTNSWYNGFNPSSAGTTITVSSPPADGAYAGIASYVEASITQNVPMFFVKALGSSFASFPVTARAVAYPGPSPSCIYGLNSISTGGANTAIYANYCVLADSGNFCDFDSVILDSLGAVYAGSLTCDQGPFVNSSPQPQPGAPAGNPLPYLLNNTPSAPSGPCSDTFCPGIYPNGINIVGTSPQTSITFGPGTYVLGGNGLSISGSGTVTGTGVTFYTNGNGAFSINAASDYAADTCPPPGVLPTNTVGMTVQFSAPTSGSEAGILLIQDDSQPGSAPPSAITLNNGDTCYVNGRNLATSSRLWGILYMPSTQLTLNGTGNGTACSDIPRFTIVIAYALQTGGNLNFGVGDCNPTFTPYQFKTVLGSDLPDPIKDAVLVE